MCSTYDVAAGAVWRVAANSSAAARLGCPIRSWASRSLCGKRRGQDDAGDLGGLDVMLVEIL